MDKGRKDKGQTTDIDNQKLCLDKLLIVVTVVQ